MLKEDIISFWSELYESRFGHSYHDVALRGDRIGASRPDETGAKIMNLFSPSLFNAIENGNEELKNSGFGCFITDKPGVFKKLGRHIQNDEKLGDGLIVLFWCKEKSMKPQDMIAYFNDWCGSVLPREFKSEDMFYLSSDPLIGIAGRGRDKTIYDFYALNLTVGFENTNFDAEKAQKVFDEQIKDEFADYDMTVRIANKDEFQKHLRNDVEMFRRMKNGRYYIGINVLKDSPVDKSVIIGILKKMTGKEYTEDQVSIVSKRRKYSKTGEFADFNLFIAEGK